MIKKVIKDNYIIEYSNDENYSEEEINKMIDDSLEIIKYKEIKDSESYYMIFSDYKYNKPGRFYVSEFGFKNADKMDANDLFITNKAKAHHFGSIEEIEEFCHNHGIEEYMILKDSSIKDAEPRLVHKNGELVEKGDEVIDFRGDKAIVTGWEAPAFEGKSGRVYVQEVLKDGSKWDAGYYPEVYGLKWKGLPWKKEEVEDIRIEDK